MHIAAIGEGFLVGLPDAVDDGGMAGITGRAVVELTREVDDLHEGSFPGSIGLAVIPVN
jgi:hypothetical protein